MKKIILFFTACVFCLSTLAFSSTPNEKNYAEAGSRRIRVAKNSEVFFYKNGAKMRETLGNCDKDCTIKFYYKNGAPHSVFKVKKNQKEGDATYFYSDSSTCRKLKFTQNHRIGKEAFYDNRGNVMKSLEYNGKGVLHGHVIEYYGVSSWNSNEKPVKKHDVEYKNGKKHGSEIWYYSDGKVLAKALYKNGEPSENRDGDQKVCYDKQGKVSNAGSVTMICGNENEEGGLGRLLRGGREGCRDLDVGYDY